VINVENATNEQMWTTAAKFTPASLFVAARGRKISERRWSSWLVGSGTGAVIRRQLLGRIRGFPLRARVEVTVIPSPVPATSHAACGFTALRAPAPVRDKGYGAAPCGSGCLATVSRQLGSHGTTRAHHTTMRGSTVSIRSRDAGAHAPGGAESSSPPSLGCTRSIDSNGRMQSTAPSRAEWD
jgi:hypothetical protein